MKNLLKLTLTLFLALSAGFFVACSSDDDTTTVVADEDGDDGDDGDGTGDVVTTLHAAFAAFNPEAVTAILSDDGTEVSIESTGLPDHQSIYWPTDNELYLDETPFGVVKTTEDTFIGAGMGGEAVSMIVDATPDLDGATVATELNTIGISVSGASIFNDQEGAGALSDAAVSLDVAGGHKGPGVYHYHLEPTPVTSDDDVLVGILMDGVFIYGRKCNATGTYPTDLDASGGHTSTTQYTDGAEEYHYHIINELYVAPDYAYQESLYVLFAGPFQGY